MQHACLFMRWYQRMQVHNQNQNQICAQEVTHAKGMPLVPEQPDAAAASSCSAQQSAILKPRRCSSYMCAAPVAQ